MGRPARRQWEHVVCVGYLARPIFPVRIWVVSKLSAFANPLGKRILLLFGVVIRTTLGFNLLDSYVFQLSCHFFKMWLRTVFEFLKMVIISKIICIPTQLSDRWGWCFMLWFLINVHTGERVGRSHLLRISPQRLPRMTRSLEEIFVRYWITEPAEATPCNRILQRILTTLASD